VTRNVYSHSNLLLDTIFFVWLRLLVGEQLNRNKPKKIVSASRGFLAAARLSCNNIASARRLIDNLGRRISENSDEAWRDQLPVPKDFNFVAVLQCCPAATDCTD